MSEGKLEDKHTFEERDRDGIDQRNSSPQRMMTDKALPRPEEKVSDGAKGYQDGPQLPLALASLGSSSIRSPRAKTPPQRGQSRGNTMPKELPGLSCESSGKLAPLSLGSTCPRTTNSQPYRQRSISDRVGDRNDAMFEARGVISPRRLSPRSLSPRQLPSLTGADQALVKSTKGDDLPLLSPKRRISHGGGNKSRSLSPHGGSTLVPMHLGGQVGEISGSQDLFEAKGIKLERRSHDISSAGRQCGAKEPGGIAIGVESKIPDTSQCAEPKRQGPGYNGRRGSGSKSLSPTPSLKRPSGSARDRPTRAHSPQSTPRDKDAKPI